MSHRIRNLLIALGGVAICVLVLPFGCTSPPSSAVTTPPIVVRGFIVAALSREGTENQGSEEVYLPGAEVFLIERSTDTNVTSDITDLSGRFTLKVPARGVYEICARTEGFQQACYDGGFDLGSESVYAEHLQLFPVRRDDAAAVFGRVSLNGGERPRLLQSLMGRNDFARVIFEDGRGARLEAPVNNYGRYVIPAVPVNDPFELRAVIEGGEARQAVDPLTGLRAGLAYRIDLRFDNTSPRLSPVFAADGTGRSLEFAQPGETVALTVRAEDDDGDNLRYQWFLPDGHGTLSSDTQPSVQWTLPASNGRYTATVVVSDGRGGYAEDRFGFRVSTGGVPFSGHVVEVGGNPVPGAEVEVNGRQVRADPEGWFLLEVPPEDRYVLNIRQTGFGSVSHILAGEATGGTWTLRPAQRVSRDPRSLIQLRQERSEKDCPGPRARRIQWSDYLQSGVLQWQDGRGHALSLLEQSRRQPGAFGRILDLLAQVHTDLARFVVQLTRTEFELRYPQAAPCGPGIAITIPADGLVDADSNPPSGNVDVTLSTVDLRSPGQMPGDLSSVDLNGDAMVMESYGAASIDIRAGATKYNLRPGVKAEVSIPVDPSQFATGAPLPATIPLLYYDESRGIWEEEATLTLAGSGSNRAYEAEVTHFSTLNADLLKSGQSCVSVVSGSGLPATYTIEVTLPPFTTGAAPSVVSFFINNASGTEHAIYNLPNNTNIVLVPIVSGTRPDGSTGDLPAGVFVVNTGGPQTSSSNLPPGPPYYNEVGGNPVGPCMTRVILSNLSIPSAPDAPYEFLEGLDLQATDLDELDASAPAIAISVRNASNAYYNLIDPRGLRQDLIDFRTRNEFGTALDAGQGELEVSAAYANSGDLGFGRNMHCRRNRASDGQFDISCYVTNYGDHLTPDTQDAADAFNQNSSTEIATVAMEYSRVENPAGQAVEFPDNSRTVKFYVYLRAQSSPTNTGQGNGRVISAELDGAGQRPVPQLCVVCHGGVYATIPADPNQPAGQKKPAFAVRNDVFMGSRFLPFDLHFFTDPPAPNTISAQEPAFRSLNLDIVRNVPSAVLASDPVVELIDELYPGGAPTQNDNAVVTNWDKSSPGSVDHRFYRDVFARACRACHTTSPFGTLVFNNKTQFRNQISNVQTRVCDQHVMPHAKRTHDLFWTSLGPNMPAFLQLYGQAISGWDATSPDAQCGLSYTAGGNVSSSFFTTDIQPIFSGQCTGCHAAASQSNANLTLSSGNAYGNLFSGVNPIPAIEHPSTPRIQPNAANGSYLYLKVEGTHTTLSGSFVAPGPGVRMPQGCTTCLDAVDTNNDGTVDIAELLFWINNLGAPGP